MSPLQSWAVLLIPVGLVLALLAVGAALQATGQSVPYDDDDLNRVDRIERQRRLAGSEPLRRMGGRR